MLTELKGFAALQAHFNAIKDIHMRDMFDKDHVRAQKMTLRLNDFVLDYSKNRITDETFRDKFQWPGNRPDIVHFQLNRHGIVRY